MLWSLHWLWTLANDKTHNIPAFSIWGLFSYFYLYLFVYCFDCFRPPFLTTNVIPHNSCFSFGLFGTKFPDAKIYQKINAGRAQHYSKWTSQLAKIESIMLKVFFCCSCLEGGLRDYKISQTWRKHTQKTNKLISSKSIDSNEFMWVDGKTLNFIVYGLIDDHYFLCSTLPSPN